MKRRYQNSLSLAARSTSLRGLCTITFCVLAAGQVMAQSTWTGATDNDWNDAGNWTGGVPGTSTILNFGGEPTNLPTNNDISNLTTGAINLTNNGSAGQTSNFTLGTLGQTVTLGGNITTTTATTGTLADIINLNLILNANRTLLVNASHNLTINGNISQNDSTARSLIKNDTTGTLTLTGNNTYTGFTEIHGGTLNVTEIADSGDSNIGFGTTMRIGNGNFSGTLNYTGTGNTTGRSVLIGSSTGTGNATINNNGANDGTGLVFSNPTFIANQGANNGNVSTLTIGGTNTDANQISGIITNSNSGFKPIALTKANGGRWILAGANTYTGNTNITGGTLRIGTAGSLGNGNYNGAIAISSGARLEYGSSAAQSLNGIISGASGITKDTSSSTLTLNDVNTYTGSTIVDEGTLALSSPGSIATASSVEINSGGTLSIAGNGPTRTLANNLTLNGGTVLGLQDNAGTGGSNISVAGGKVTHTFTASGTLNLVTSVSASQLIVGGGGGAGGGFAGTAFNAGGGGGEVRNLTGQTLSAGATTITIGAGGAGASFGNGANGSATSIGSNTAGGGLGATTTVAGTGGTSGSGFAGGLKVNSASQSAGGGGGNSAVGSTATSNTVGGAGGAGSLGTITNATYGGGGGGGGSVTQQSSGGSGGGGNGSNAGGFAGAANTGGGGGGGQTGAAAGGSGIAVVQYDYVTSAGNVTLSGTIDLRSASTLDAYGSGGLLDVTGVISTSAGAGGLTIASSNAAGGVVRLGNNNTYAGATSVNTGATLVLNGNQSLATGAVSVTGKLTGAGTVGGATTINSAGIHNAGNPAVAGGVGTQTFTNTLIYSSGSIFEWDITSSLDADGVDGDDGAAGTNFDSVAGAGTKVANSGSIFEVVLGGTALTDIQNSGNLFWNTPYITQVWNMTSIFSSFSGGFTQVQTSTDVSARGSFTITGSALTWTAVPEPTSALAGLLITAGLLRRRRI